MHTTDDYAARALAAVNLGDDADTTGAIYGQLAGAVYVLDGIPERWRRFTAHSDEIVALADGLYELAKRIAPPAAAAAGGAGSLTAASPQADDALPLDVFWVREGQIAAGPYPGAPTRAEAEAKLTALLTAGITTFIDLTEERDRYRQLAPYSELLKRTAAKVGVRATHLRLPIDDTDVPPAWRMRVILDAIDTAVAAGEVAYIHCWGGVGRTGMVVGCLLREAGASTEAVLDELQALRAHTPRGQRRRSPENARQSEYVTGWVAGRRR